MAANQGSRAGLITSVVILSIVSVVAVIFAFWYGAEKRKTDQDLVDLRKRYGNVISDNALVGAEVKELEAVRAEPGGNFTAQSKLWDVAMGQRSQMVKLLTGRDATGENTASDAIKQATTTLNAANEKVQNANTRLPSTTDDLLGAVNVLADKVKVQADTIADRDAKLKEANKLATTTIDETKKALALRDEQVKEAVAKAGAVIQSSTDDRSKQQTTVADIEKAREEERKNQAVLLAKKEAELASKTNEVTRLEERLKTTQARFDRIRVGVTDPITRAGDGVISGFSGKEIVYVNLGEGQQIIPGMTFEVYDKSRGIPQIKDPLEQDQPAGKATIEVLRVLPSTSECRVTRIAHGMNLMQGDPILNIVYDANIKYNFLVFGKFDLDHNGVATLQDADVVKRIITQWGARVSPKLGVDTDFLVLGKEPVVPTLTAEQLNDPLEVTKQQKATEELTAYQDVLKEAREMHIPILNQNRFLNFTGQAGAVTR